MDNNTEQEQERPEISGGSLAVLCSVILMFLLPAVYVALVGNGVIGG